MRRAQQSLEQMAGGVARATGDPIRVGSDGHRLLERERELAVVEEAIAAAGSGEGGAVLISAEAGLGKSSLLAAAARLAEARGFRVLTAVGRVLERDHAWGGAIQLFSELARDDRADDLFAGAAERVRPLADPSSRQAADAPAADPFPILHGLYWLAAGAAGRGPLLLSLDDAHWLDPETLRFAAFLLDRIEDLPIALLLAERPGEPRPESSCSAIGEIRRNRRTRELHPAPLRPGAIASLVRSRLPEAGDDLCEAVAEASAGNPFLSAELAEAARAGADSAPLSADAVRRLRPSAIRESTAARLAALGDDAGEIAASVAILGPTTQARAARLAGMDEGTAAAAMDALVSAALLRAGPDGIAFVHPIVAELVYEGIAPSRRSRMHAAAARLLREEAAPAEEVAAQLLRAEPQAEYWAVKALRDAASRARSRGASDAAARYLGRALACVGDRPQRRTVLFELGAAEAAASLPHSAERLRAALDAPGEEPPPALIAACLGEDRYARGEYGSAMAAFERGIAEIEGDGRPDPALEARLLGGLGSASELALAPSPLVRERTEAALAATATRPPTPAERVLLAIATGTSALRGEVPRDGVVSIAGRALAGEGGRDLDRTVLEPVAAGLGVSDEKAGLEILDAAIAAARARGEIAAYAGTLAIRSFYRWRFGELMGALADAGDALRLGGRDPFLSPARIALACGLLDRGEPEAAAESLERKELAPERKVFLFAAYDLAASGRVALALGDREAARSALSAAEAEFRRVAPNPAICEWRSDAALAAHRLGETEAALSLADEDVELARRFGAPRAIGLALRGRALVEGSSEAAVERLREAAEVLAAGPSPLEHARALLDLGAALRRAGWDRDARDPLREAAATAAEIGARGIAGRANEELVASGASPRPEAKGGVASLTPSELRVARMVAAGMSNREVAEALFLARRTVETHLTHTYSKLGISSRRELPAALGDDAAEP